jgi:primosomal protein N'
MKIALLHDSFTQMGGAERVVDDLHEIFPKAPVFTLAFDPKYKEKYKNWDNPKYGKYSLV